MSNPQSKDVQKHAAAEHALALSYAGHGGGGRQRLDGGILHCRAVEADGGLSAGGVEFGAQHRRC